MACPTGQLRPFCYGASASQPCGRFFPVSPDAPEQSFEEEFFNDIFQNDPPTSPVTPKEISYPSSALESQTLPGAFGLETGGLVLEGRLLPQGCGPSSFLSSSKQQHLQCLRFSFSWLNWSSQRFCQHQTSFHVHRVFVFNGKVWMLLYSIIETLPPTSVRHTPSSLTLDSPPVGLAMGKT